MLVAGQTVSLTRVTCVSTFDSHLRRVADFGDSECPCCLQVCHCAICTRKNFKGNDVRMPRPLFYSLRLI
jgi:hypothetical protein